MRKIIFGLLFCATFFGCESDMEQKTNAENTVEFKKAISDDKVMELYLNDQNTRLSILGKSSLSLEEKASYFELNTIKDYINNLEELSSKNNIEIAGVNFVFGATHKGDRTVFLMPTIYNTTKGYNMSFSVVEGEVKPFKQVSKSLVEIENGSINSSLILSTNGSMSYNDAVVLFNRFQTNYIEQIETKIVKEYYTKSAGYSLHEIKEYMEYLENIQLKEDINIDGVNVFYGVHNGTHPQYPNGQTLFLLPSQIENGQGKSLKVKIETFKGLLSNIENGNSDNSSLKGVDEFNLVPPPPIDTTSTN